MMPGGGRLALVLVVAVQVLCTLFFVSDIVAGVLGLRRAPMAWETRELIEIGAALGLVLGVALARCCWCGPSGATGGSRASSAGFGAFAALLEERFADWGLTPSERDVAWFTIKGLSIAEIARLRRPARGRSRRSRTRSTARPGSAGGRSSSACSSRT